MIGKPEWFTYRIFGWGLRPKTKQGWLYILIALIIGVLTYFIHTIAFFTYVAVLTLDMLHIMTQMGKHADEREKLHHLIVERNCSFAAIAVIVTIILYQSIKNIGVNTSLIIVLGVMLLVKIGSTIYVKKKI